MNIIWQEFEMYNILGLKVFPLTVAKFLLCTFLNVFFNLGGSQNEVRWRFRPDAFGIQRLKVYNTGNWSLLHVLQSQHRCQLCCYGNTLQTVSGQSRQSHWACRSPDEQSCHCLPPTYCQPYHEALSGTLSARKRSKIPFLWGYIAVMAKNTAGLEPLRFTTIRFPICKQSPTIFCCPPPFG